MHNHLRLAVFGICFLAFSTSSWAYVDLKSLAVQNRKHTMTHEFTAWIGTLPMDAFVKGLAFSGAYSIHFNDLLAWEVGNFTYSHGIKTKLEDELANLPQPVAPTAFETVKYYVTSNFIFKPVYGKLAVLNRNIIFAELFTAVGAGYAWMSITTRPVADVGAGLRIYAGDYLSFRFDIRDVVMFNDQDVHNDLWIALGMSISFK